MVFLQRVVIISTVTTQKLDMKLSVNTVSKKEKPNKEKSAFLKM